MPSQNAPVYLPSGNDTTEDKWAMVGASLRAAGYTDIRPAPPASLSYLPRHCRYGQRRHRALVAASLACLDFGSAR